jgi:hypothetical protein
MIVTNIESYGNCVAMVYFEALNGEGKMDYNVMDGDILDMEYEEHNDEDIYQEMHDYASKHLTYHCIIIHHGKQIGNINDY